jgi:hypothetical protein
MKPTAGAVSTNAAGLHKRSAFSHFSEELGIMVHDGNNLRQDYQ